ncbi:hypothetical protein HK101_003638 [Irineochytrium annulatum]|nr:hypothetical protein HK101_003638 [Irineochytrium annulatum]
MRISVAKDTRVVDSIRPAPDVAHLTVWKAEPRDGGVVSVVSFVWTAPGYGEEFARLAHHSHDLWDVAGHPLSGTFDSEDGSYIVGCCQLHGVHIAVVYSSSTSRLGWNGPEQLASAIAQMASKGPLTADTVTSKYKELMHPCSVACKGVAADAKTLLWKAAELRACPLVLPPERHHDAATVPTASSAFFGSGMEKPAARVESPKFGFSQEGKRLLEAIPGNVHIYLIATVGKYRDGKSALMNLLLRKTITSVTSFVTTIIYNVKQHPGNSIVDKVEVLKTVADLIKGPSTSTKQGETSKLSIGTKLFFACRDFDFKTPEGRTRHDMMTGLIQDADQQTLKALFDKILIHGLPTPAFGGQLQRVATLPWKDMTPNFVTAFTEFYDALMRETAHLQGSAPANGVRLHRSGKELAQIIACSVRQISDSNVRSLRVSDMYRDLDIYAAAQHALECATAQFDNAKRELPALDVTIKEKINEITKNALEGFKTAVAALNAEATKKVAAATLESDLKRMGAMLALANSDSCRKKAETLRERILHEAPPATECTHPGGNEEAYKSYRDKIKGTRGQLLLGPETVTNAFWDAMLSTLDTNLQAYTAHNVAARKREKERLKFQQQVAEGQAKVASLAANVENKGQLVKDLNEALKVEAQRRKDDFERLTKEQDQAATNHLKAISELVATKDRELRDQRSQLQAEADQRCNTLREESNQLRNQIQRLQNEVNELKKKGGICAIM